MGEQEMRVIVYVCFDLIFASKIGSTAAALKLPARPARDSLMLVNRLNQVDDGKANGPVALVVIDLSVESAIQMIQQVKQHRASPTVLAYGSHLLVERMQQARSAGADEVMSNGALASKLPQLLLAWASPST